MTPSLLGRLALASGLVLVSALGVGRLPDAPALAPTKPGAPPASRPGPVAADSCKPQAPIEVVLEQRVAAGERVELQFSIRPLVAMRDVRWELQLPADAVPLQGTTAGEADGTRDVRTPGSATVRLPDDGEYRRARLRVSGTFTGSDETGAEFDEPFVATATLAWGNPPPPAPLALTPDADTGLLGPAVALPVRHRPGR